MHTSVANSLLGSTFVGGSAIFGLLFCCIYLLIMLIGLVLFVMWIWMLVDLIQRKEGQFGNSFGNGNDAKVIWLILMLVTGGIASIIYYFLVYKKHPRTK